MSETKGKLTTCDRCGKEIFRKYIGKGEMDGGYTTWDKFEDLPEDMDCDQRKIASSWQMKPGDEGLVNTITF